MGPSLIPPPRDDDEEDVHWALSTAAALWQRGEKPEALRWLRKAAEHALDANRDDRSLELARLAADLGPGVAAVASTPPPAPARAPSIPAPSAPSRPPPHPPPVRVGASPASPAPPARGSVPAPAPLPREAARPSAPPVARPSGLAAQAAQPPPASSPLLQRRLGAPPGAAPPANVVASVAASVVPDAITTRRAPPEPLQGRAQATPAPPAAQPRAMPNPSSAAGTSSAVGTSSRPASASTSPSGSAPSRAKASGAPTAATRVGQPQHGADGQGAEPALEDTRPRARRRTKTGTGPAPQLDARPRAPSAERASPQRARAPEPAPFDGFDEELTQQHEQATIVRAPPISPQRFAEIEAQARRPDDLDEETSVLSRLDDAPSDASSTLDRTAQNWASPSGLDAPTPAAERAPEPYDPYATVREMPAVPSSPAPAEPAPAEPTHAEPTRAEAAELAPPLAAIRVAVAPLEGGGLRVVALGNDLAAPPGAAIAILVPVSEADSDFLRRELVG